MPHPAGYGYRTHGWAHGRQRFREMHHTFKNPIKKRRWMQDSKIYNVTLLIRNAAETLKVCAKRDTAREAFLTGPG